MHTRWLIGLFGVLFLPRALKGFEVLAVLRKVDIERGVHVVLGGAKERSVKVAKDARFLDEQGQPLAGGIRSNELKEGIAVTLDVEPDGKEPIIKALQIGGKKAA